MASGSMAFEITTPTIEQAARRDGHNLGRVECEGASVELVQNSEGQLKVSLSAPGHMAATLVAIVPFQTRLHVALVWQQGESVLYINGKVVARQSSLN